MGIPERDRGRAPRRRLGTRPRLLLAFAVLAAAFAGAFGSLLVGLGGIERRLAYLHEHEGQMRLVLDLDDLVRRHYGARAHRLADALPTRAQHGEARGRIADRFALLTAEVDEAEPMRWVAAAAAAARELDRIFEEQLAAGPGDPAAASRRERTLELVFTVEENLDRLFAFLRDQVALQSGALGELHLWTLRLAVGFVIGTLLLAGVLALHLSRSIAGPLAVLGAGASRIASGDLETRIDLDGPDELGRLAAEFNAMAASLRQHQDRLVRSEKLAGLGRVAAGIAHELNNPLQVMLGYVSLDRGRVKGDVAVHLARIEREATRCKEIVEALLQLSRPAVAFAPVPVDLREVAEEVADAVRVAMGARAPAITVAGEAVATGTRCRFRQIVFNLARNAADAAGPGGEVRIDITPAGPQVGIAVSDTGPGIPPEVRGRVFEPFFTTKAQGTGLGLAIARAMAASLGGDIELDPSAPRGARFTVHVPGAPGTP